jgi:hypothetical protein
LFRLLLKLEQRSRTNEIPMFARSLLSESFWAMF